MTSKGFLALLFALGALWLAAVWAVVEYAGPEEPVTEPVSIVSEG